VNEGLQKRNSWCRPEKKLCGS